MDVRTRIFIFLTFILQICSNVCLSQQAIPDTINKKRVVELQTIQTKANTFISAVMVDPPGGAGFGNYDRSLYIYRSTDNGANWDSVYYYGGGSGFYGTVDPVITTDSSGHINVVVMRSYPLNNSFYSHLWTFRSTNDGLSWVTYTNTYDGNDLADYPSITAKNNNLLFLSYSIYTNSLDSSYVVFKRSLDGGVSWSNLKSFNTSNASANQLAGMGSNLGWTMNDKLCLSFGDNTIPFISFTTSADTGKTWMPLQSIAMPTTATFIATKIVSSKNHNHLGIVAWHPHSVSYVYYLTSLDGGATWTNQMLSNKGAYCDGVMDNFGNIHLVYNESKNGGAGQLTYRYSVDNGQTFSNALPLINWTSTVFSEGEYQSVIIGQDGLLHATYIDWNDGDKCRHLVFAPLLNSIHEVDANSKAPKVFPIPAKSIINVSNPQKNEVIKYSITDLAGKLMRSGVSEYDTIQIDISELISGTYILSLEQNLVTYLQKIIKE